MHAPVAIIGGGLMGVGIAQVFAAAGHDVRIMDPDAAVRGSVIGRLSEGLAALGEDPSCAARVTVTDRLEEAAAGAAFVTEAAPERLEMKQSIFARLVEAAPADAILASNSSVIPISSIAAGLRTADRMVGTHWWNPAPLIPLVEVIQGEGTSAGTVTRTIELLRRLGKKPAHVRKDVPGFVGNRLQHALWREAIAMVAEGICDAQTVDDCVKNSFGLRLPVLGPLENADLVGLDLTRDIHRVIIPELDRSAAPNPILDRYIEAGRFGFKSGEGFRRWSGDEQATVRRRLIDHLLKMKRAGYT